NVHVIKSNSHLIHGPRSERSGVSHRGAICVFVADTGAGITAVRQPGQGRGSNIFSPALGIAHEKLVFLRGVEIHADIPLVDAILLNGRDDEVVRFSWLIFQRIQIHERLRDGVDSIGRNHIVRKREAIFLIVNGGLSWARKVACSFREQWYFGTPHQRIPDSCSLIVAKEEEFVFNGWAAEGGPKLLLFERWLLVRW